MTPEKMKTFFLEFAFSAIPPQPLVRPSCCPPCRRREKVGLDSEVRAVMMLLAREPACYIQMGKYQVLLLPLGSFDRHSPVWIMR